MAAPTFVEQSPHEQRFARVFSQDIAPELERVERARLHKLRKFVSRVGISGGALVLLVAVVLMLPISALTAAKVLPTLVILGLVVAAIWAHGPYTAHKAELRRLLVGPICRFLGDLEYTRKPNWGYGPLRFRKLGVIPRYGRAEIEDMFEGRHRDTGFRVAEARLIRGGGRYQVTVFNGLLFEIEVPVEFGCRILIFPNRGWLGNRLTESVGRWLRGPLAGKTPDLFHEC